MEIYMLLTLLFVVGLVALFAAFLYNQVSAFESFFDNQRFDPDTVEEEEILKELYGKDHVL